MFDTQDREGYAQRVIENVKPEFFKEKDLKTALGFLQGMCCENVSDNSKCTSAIKQQKKYYAESKHLYDQLVYVGMTKLDGNQDHCDTLNVECYPKATERREKITKIAESREWVPPSLITLSFSGVWWWDPGSFLQAWDNNLSAAYAQMCREVEHIYTSIGLSQWGQAALEQTSANCGDTATTRSQCCEKLIEDRYSQEIQYIKSLQVEKGMKYYTDNIDSYLNTYFFQNRGMTLLETIQEINTCFTPVLHLVDKTENCCVRGKE